METVANDIRNFLKKFDRTPTWFAKQCDLSQATISRILAGEQKNLTDETKNKIYRVIENRHGREEEMDKQFIAGLMKQISDLTAMVRDLQTQLAKANFKLQERRSDPMVEKEESLLNRRIINGAPIED